MSFQNYSVSEKLLEQVNIEEDLTYNHNPLYVWEEPLPDSTQELLIRHEFSYPPAPPLTGLYTLYNDKGFAKIEKQPVSGSFFKNNITTCQLPRQTGGGLDLGLSLVDQPKDT